MSCTPSLTATPKGRLTRPLYYCGVPLPLAILHRPTYLPSSVKPRGAQACAYLRQQGGAARWAHQPALGSPPGRPPAAGPADRAHVMPASQSPGARRRARRRWRGLLGTTNTGGTAGRARAPPAVSPRPECEGTRGQGGRGLTTRRAGAVAVAPGRESGLSAAGWMRARPWSAGPRADPERSPGASPTLRRWGRQPWGRGGRGSGGVTGPAVRGAAAAASVTEGGGEAGGGRGSPRGRVCCGLAGALGCAAGAGRRGPPRHGLTKSDGPARGSTVPTGPGGRAGTLDEWRGGRGTSCLGPRPGPLPEGFEAAGLRAPVPRRLRGQRLPPYSPAR